MEGKYSSVTLNPSPFPAVTQGADRGLIIGSRYIANNIIRLLPADYRSPLTFYVHTNLQFSEASCNHPEERPPRLRDRHVMGMRC